MIDSKLNTVAINLFISNKDKLIELICERGIIFEYELGLSSVLLSLALILFKKY